MSAKRKPPGATRAASAWPCVRRLGGAPSVRPPLQAGEAASGFAVAGGGSMRTGTPRFGRALGFLLPSLVLSALASRRACAVAALALTASCMRSQRDTPALRLRRVQLHPHVPVGAVVVNWRPSWAPPRLSTKPLNQKWNCLFQARSIGVQP